MQNLRCWAEIDLAALERNLNRIRSALPTRIKYISVVKADAYGHGIHPTAARLMQSGVDLFAVANVKEAADIREMGSGWPILILGPLLKEEDSAILEYDLIPSLSNEDELNRFIELGKRKGKPQAVHFKIDTGMGRMGCWWEVASALLQKVLHAKEIDLQGVLTHFPIPHNVDFTNLQRERFSFCDSTCLANSDLIYWSMQITHPASKLWNTVAHLTAFALVFCSLGWLLRETVCLPT